MTRRPVRRLRLDTLEDRTVFDVGLSREAFAGLVTDLNTRLGQYQAAMNSLLDPSTPVLPVIGKSSRGLFGATDSPATAKNVNGVLNGVRPGRDEQTEQNPFSNLRNITSDRSLSYSRPSGRPELLFGEH